MERNGDTRSAKKSQDGAQEAAKCCQDGDLGSFWDHFLMIWDAFLLTGCKSKNLEKPKVFKGFLKIWGLE